MKKLVAVLAGLVLVFMAVEAVGQKKTLAKTAAEAEEPEEKETIRPKRPGELVLYRIGSVECSVHATEKGFLFRAESKYAPSGWIIHRVEVDRNGAALSNMNYIFHSGAREWSERPAIYYLFYNQCLRYRVRVVGNREFPATVLKAIGDKNWLELFTARAF